MRGSVPRSYAGRDERVIVDPHVRGHVERIPVLISVRVELHVDERVRRGKDVGFVEKAQEATGRVGSISIPRGARKKAKP